MHILLVLSFCLPTFLCSMEVQQYEALTRGYHSGSDDECVVMLPVELLDGAAAYRDSDCEIEEPSGDTQYEMQLGFPQEVSEDTITALSASVREHHITIESLDHRLAQREKADQEEAFDRECTAITAGGALFVGTVSFMLSIVNLVAQSSDSLSAGNGTDI